MQGRWIAKVVQETDGKSDSVVVSQILPLFSLVAKAVTEISEHVNVCPLLTSNQIFFFIIRSTGSIFLYGIYALVHNEHKH